MPVTELEYAETLEEGVKVNFGKPHPYCCEDWKVTGLHCIKMRLGEPGVDGRRRPVAIPGTEYFVEADTVFAAVGQAPDLSFLPPDSVLERTRWETLVVDKNNLTSNIPGIFAGGDFVTGPDMIIEAIAAGRRGALAIDKYLQGDPSRVEMYDLKPLRQPQRALWKKKYLEEKFRPEIPRLPFEERKRSFAETELGLKEEQAGRKVNAVCVAI